MNSVAVQNAVVIPDGAVHAVNQLFIQLRAIFPAWKGSFPDEKSYREAKRIWLETLVNEGITTIEQLQNGLDRAKKSNKPFWPSVGEFIDWCKQVNYQALGLPDEAELLKRVREFQGFGMTEIDKFKFKSNAEYWLITGLYTKCRVGEWSDKQLEEGVKKELAQMVKRIKQGEQVPPPTLTLEKKTTLPLDPRLQRILDEKRQQGKMR